MYPFQVNWCYHPESNTLTPWRSIIAVHGLNGHRTESWSLIDGNTTAEKKKTWLKDLLPDYIPQARVLTFGYDSGITAEGVVSMTGIVTKALELLKALHLEADSHMVEDPEHRLKTEVCCA